MKEWTDAKRLTPREAAELCIKIAKALHHAHEAGVIHRDLKPGNIMMDTDGEPHIVDFGLAKREAGEITMTVEGQILGTPAYMSPEQARGEGHTVDRRADIYSFGAILFELQTGDLPFRGDMQMLILQILKDEPPKLRKLNSRVPVELETICLKCLEKDPSRRYDTATALADELQRFLDGKPILARPVRRTERTWRWCKRNPVVAGLSAAVVASLIVGMCVSSYFAISAYQHANTAQQRLYTSLVREAAAIRRARDVGYRSQVWSRLTSARALGTSNLDVFELRQEAVAAMGDFVGLEPIQRDDFTSDICSIDASDNYLAVGLSDGTLSMRRITDGQKISRLEHHKRDVRANDVKPIPIDRGILPPFVSVPPLVSKFRGPDLITIDHQGQLKRWMKSGPRRRGLRCLRTKCS